MKYIVPEKYTKISKSLPAFLEDKEAIKAFRKIMSECDENSEIIFNFDGSYGEDKRKRLDIDYRFLRLLPQKGTIILNFSNISVCDFCKTCEWRWENIKKCEINFNNSEFTHIQIREEYADNDGFCENLVINTNESGLSCHINNDNIKNIKIISPQKKMSDHIFINRLYNCNSINLSEFNNWKDLNFCFSMIDKQTKWFIPQNMNIKDLKRLHDYGSVYFNSLEFEQKPNNINGLTTVELKNKYFKPINR